MSTKLVGCPVFSASGADRSVFSASGADSDGEYFCHQRSSGLEHGSSREMEGIFAECCRGFGRTKTYGDLRGDIWDNPPVLSHRRPDGAVVADPTPALVRQASIADDETTGVALHSAGEDVVPFGVVGTGVLHILLDDVGAIDAGGAEGVGRRSGLGHANRPGGNSEQSSCRQPNVTGWSRAR